MSVVTSNSISFVANGLLSLVRYATAIFQGPWSSFSRVFTVAIEQTVPFRSSSTKKKMLLLSPYELVRKFKDFT